MTSPPPASKLPFLDRHLRPWLESFGCIGGRHEMKRSHAQRSNFKVIESERISTFRKDCTGSRGARFRPVRGYGCGCQRHLIGSRHPRARDRGRALRRSIPRGRDAASQPVPRQAQPGGRLPGKQRLRLPGNGHGVQRMGKLPCDSCMGILRSHIRMDRFRRAFLLKASFGGRDLFRVQVTLVAHLMGMTPAFLTRNKLRPCCHASRFFPWR